MSRTKAEIEEWVQSCVTYIKEKQAREAFFNVRLTAQELRDSGAAEVPFVAMQIERKRRFSKKVAGVVDVPDPSILSRLDFYELRDFLVESEKSMHSLVESFDRVDGHFEMGEMIPFDSAGPMVHRAREALITAWIEVRRELRQAQEEIEFSHPPRGRKKPYHRSALKLAMAIFHPDQEQEAYEVAEKIMSGAGLDLPHRKSMKEWRDEILNPKPEDFADSGN